MIVQKVGSKYVATKITGPSHNYLGIVIGARGADSGPLVVDLEKIQANEGSKPNA